MGILEGRKAIVTGASSGVGYGVALRFAQEGADVVAGARRKEKLEALAREAEKRGFPGKILPVVCDIEKEEDLDRLTAVCGEQLGRIDILAPIAQGGLFQQKNIFETDMENLLLFYRTGPGYTLQLIQKCLPYMQKQHYGRIITCASGAALTYVENSCAYGMAKAAIINLTRTCAHEFGKFGIVTNCFLPVCASEGFSDPDSPGGKKYLEMMAEAIPVKYFGDAYEDVSPVVAFLASEGAKYINGQVISACGGCMNPV